MTDVSVSGGRAVFMISWNHLLASAENWTSTPSLLLKMHISRTNIKMWSQVAPLYPISAIAQMKGQACGHSLWYHVTPSRYFPNQFPVRTFATIGRSQPKQPTGSKYQGLGPLAGNVLAMMPSRLYVSAAAEQVIWKQRCPRWCATSTCSTSPGHHLPCFVGAGQIWW